MSSEQPAYFQHHVDMSEPSAAADDGQGEPWFKDGLRFECTACGNCCTEPEGYVWVNEQEIAALAAQLGLSVAAFEAKYVKPMGAHKSLDERLNGDCVFLDGSTRKCTVYSVRPRQCRTWPFWNSNLRSPEAWEQTRKNCPGCGQGRLYQLEEVQQHASVIDI